MGYWDSVKEIRHEEVCVLRIGLMDGYYSMYFYYLLLCAIYVLSMHQLADLLMYLSLSVIHCISAELFPVCQTVGVLIGQGLPD